MNSSKLSIYLLIRLFEIQWMSQHGSFSSYYHIGVCIIFEEVVHFNERFMPTLGGLWRATDLLFKRNPLMHCVFLVPTIHWMII
jgi:hypothetical protein